MLNGIKLCRLTGTPTSAYLLRFVWPGDARTQYGWAWPLVIFVVLWRGRVSSLACSLLQPIGWSALSIAINLVKLEKLHPLEWRLFANFFPTAFFLASYVDGITLKFIPGLLAHGGWAKTCSVSTYSPLKKVPLSKNLLHSTTDFFRTVLPEFSWRPFSNMSIT